MRSALVLFFNIIFVFTRWEAKASQKEEIFEGNDFKHATVNVVTGLYEGGEEAEEIVTEYYDSGKYEGRIKHQFANIEGKDDLVLVSRFVYHENFTEVYDLFDRKTVFYFDENKSVKLIENYDINGKRLPSEFFCWEDELLKEVGICDGNGKILKKKCIKQQSPSILPANFPSKKDVFEYLFGPAFSVQAGYYEESLESGVQGKGEISDKVRVTYINGILNLKKDCLDTTQLISRFHGGVNVHYIYRPTQGWTGDLIGSAKVKLGFLSPQAYLLADKWKELIHEMGGTEQGGKIIHYAHSVGASDSWNARTLMSAEEKSMISVVTLGSPFMIHKDGLHSVINYVAVRDGVSLLDPIGYIRGLAFENNNIKFVGSAWGMPLVDHMVEGNTYETIIQALGEEFVETYGSLELAQ